MEDPPKREGAKYLDMRPGEEARVSRLVREVFNEFVAPGYLPEGIATFYKFTAPEAIRNRIDSGRNFLLLAEVDGHLAGVLEMKDYRHICLLFVDRRYQGRGIARNLVTRAIIRCLSLDPTLTTLTVNSSPYALSFYRRMGFAATQPEQEKNGIRFIPMQLVVRSFRET